MDFQGQPPDVIQMKSDHFSRATDQRISVWATGGGVAVHELSLHLSGEELDRLLGHMRFIVLNPTSEGRLHEVCPNTYCRPISANNEQQALQYLASLIETVLQGYSTSAEEDRKLIEGGSARPVSSAKRSALVLRYGEKRLLESFRKLLHDLEAFFVLGPRNRAAEGKPTWHYEFLDGYVQGTLSTLLDGNRSFVNDTYEKIPGSFFDRYAFAIIAILGVIALLHENGMIPLPSLLPTAAQAVSKESTAIAASATQKGKIGKRH